MGSSVGHPSSSQDLVPDARQDCPSPGILFGIYGNSSS